MMLIKAIIFDFDGVITESVHIKTRGFAHLFRDCADDVIQKIVQFHLDNGGMSRFEKFRVFYRDFLGKSLSQEEEERLGREFSEFCYGEIITCPYVHGALEFLEDNRSNYSMFVVSGTPHEEINNIIDARELRKYFKEVWGSPRSKADLSRMVLKKYNLESNQVVFVGDAPTDYWGAQEVGIPFIARVPIDTYNPFAGDIYEIEHSIEDLSSLADVLNSMG